MSRSSAPLAVVLASAMSTGCAPASGPAPGAAVSPTAAEAETTPSAPPPSASVASNAAPPARPAGDASPAIDYTSCALPKSLAARGWPTELSPTSETDPAPLLPGTTTIVALPDTQYYASCRSPHLARQAQWIADVATERNVAAVVQLGDLTDHNTPEEWSFVHAGLAPLVGRVPLALATGNHDHGDGGTANRRGSLFQQYFGSLGGATAAALAATKDPSDRENAYFRVKLPKVTLGFLVLEWSPRKSTVDWANRVLTQYATDRMIVATHAYLYHDATRYDFRVKAQAQEWNPLEYGTAKDSASKPGGTETAHDGEMLWTELVKRHKGIFLMASGHVLVDGTAVLTSAGTRGNRVHQVLVNYQMLKEGGLGYLRLFELLPDGKTLRMKTYSPSLRRYATGPEQGGDLEIVPPLWR